MNEVGNCNMTSIYCIDKNCVTKKRVSWPLSRASVFGLLKLAKDGERLGVDVIDNDIVLWEEFILGGVVCAPKTQQ